jgi:hypothetical protein
MELKSFALLAQQARSLCPSDAASTPLHLERGKLEVFRFGQAIVQLRRSRFDNPIYTLARTRESFHSGDKL